MKRIALVMSLVLVAPAARQSIEFGVDAGEKLLPRHGIAVTRLIQQLGYLAHSAGS